MPRDAGHRGQRVLPRLSILREGNVERRLPCLSSRSPRDGLNMWCTATPQSPGAGRRCRRVVPGAGQSALRSTRSTAAWCLARSRSATWGLGFVPRFHRAPSVSAMTMTGCLRTPGPLHALGEFRYICHMREHLQVATTACLPTPAASTRPWATARWTQSFRNASSSCRHPTTVLPVRLRVRRHGGDDGRPGLNRSSR